MRKRILALLAMTAAALGLAVLVNPGAAFAVDTCINHVTHTTTWGSGRTCIKLYHRDGYDEYAVDVRTDDTLTDGYCVHAEMKIGSNPWFRLMYPDTIVDSESCGPVQDTGLFYAASQLTEIRLVRGTGGDGIGINYMTIWPD